MNWIDFRYLQASLSVLGQVKSNIFFLQIKNKNARKNNLTQISVPLKTVEFCESADVLNISSTATHKKFCNK
jgi:hypothetical protein